MRRAECRGCPERPATALPGGPTNVRAARNCAGRARCVMSPESTIRSGRCCRPAPPALRRPALFGAEVRVRDLQQDAHPPVPSDRDAASTAVAVAVSSGAAISSYSGLASTRKSSGARIRVTSPSNATFTPRRPGASVGRTTMCSNSKRSTLCASPSVPSPVQHQPDHRQRADRPQHDCGDATTRRAALRVPQWLYTELFAVEPVVATNRVKVRTSRTEAPVRCADAAALARSSVALAAQNATRRCARSAPCTPRGLPADRGRAEAGVDQEYAVVHGRHLHRRRRPARQ